MRSDFTECFSSLSPITWLREDRAKVRMEDLTAFSTDRDKTEVIRETTQRGSLLGLVFLAYLTRGSSLMESIKSMTKRVFGRHGGIDRCGHLLDLI